MSGKTSVDPPMLTVPERASVDWVTVFVETDVEVTVFVETTVLVVEIVAVVPEVTTDVTVDVLPAPTAA
jgi:hypothetical protein